MFRVDRINLDLGTNAQIRAQLFRRGGDVDGYMRRRANRVAITARALCPVRTGRLRSTIEVRQPRAATGQFTAGYEVTAGGPAAPYALYVHEGTRPHRIAVRNAQVLTDGFDFFGREVLHPGTRPQPFLARALRRQQ